MLIRNFHRYFFVVIVKNVQVPKCTICKLLFLLTTAGFFFYVINIIWGYGCCLGGICFFTFVVCIQNKKKTTQNDLKNNCMCGPRGICPY